MAALKPPQSTQRASSPEEGREDRVATFYARAWMFYENNRWVVYGAAVALLAVIVGLVGYFYLQAQQQAEAEEHFSAIMSFYEQGDYETALEGTEAELGLREIAENYSRTDTGAMAAFYAGDALFALGQKEEALEYFEQVPEQNTLVGAGAVAGRAAVYEDQGEYERAGNTYRDAAALYTTDFTTPEYLLRAGRAYERAGLFDEAVESYTEISEGFPEFADAHDIELHLARVESQRERQAQVNS